MRLRAGIRPETRLVFRPRKRRNPVGVRGGKGYSPRHFHHRNRSTIARNAGLRSRFSRHITTLYESEWLSVRRVPLFQARRYGRPNEAGARVPREPTARISSVTI